MSAESESERLQSESARPVVLLVQQTEANGDDVMDLVAELWRRKWLVLAFSLAFALAGVVWALLAPAIYRVEVVLAPAQSNRGTSVSTRLGGLASLAGLNLNTGVDSVSSVAVLASRGFAEMFIKENALLPVLFADEWDEDSKQWREHSLSKQPTLWEGVRYFTENVMFVEHDEVTGLTTLAIEWTDPIQAAAWAEQLVTRINEQLRTRDLERSQRKLKYLYSALEDANLLEVRQAIAAVIEEQVQTIALAESDPEYAFRVIDPARVPAKRARPRRILIVVLGGFSGGLVGTCLVLGLYLIRQRQRRANASA